MSPAVRARRPHPPLARRFLALALGSVLALALLEVGMRVAAATYLRIQDRSNQASLAAGGEVRVLCIGESTTAFGGPKSYPRQLEEALNAQEGRARFSVVNRGVPAATSDMILDNLDRWLDRYDPHIVVAMMGINDHWLPSEPYAEGGLREGLLSLRTVQLARLLALRAQSDPSAAERPRAASRPPEERPDAEASEAELLAALEESPEAIDARHRLATLYAFQRRFEEAKGLLESGVDSGLADDETRGLLRKVYSPVMSQAMRERRFADAESMVRRGMALTPPEASIAMAEWYGALGLILQARGEPALAAEYFERANGIRLHLFNPMTRRNYNELKRRLDLRGIALVSVQYPVRSVEPLQRLLRRPEEVTFVDNEETFKRALAGGDFAHYFVDGFAGDFGHMTDAGHALLAQNIADSVLALVEEQL